jgi:hypothetical protein
MHWKFGKLNMNMKADLLLDTTRHDMTPAQLCAVLALQLHTLDATPTCVLPECVFYLTRARIGR